MINFTIIKEWIEALRSGEYQQGKYSLKVNENTYCCLGVLCDKVKPKKWKLKGEDYTIYNQEENLPVEILKILGVEDRGGNFEISSNNTKLLEILKEKNISEWESYTLATLNDSYEHDLTFNQIADILEAEFF